MDMIKLTGLWKNEGPKGVYFSGSLGVGGKALVFRNDNKRTEKDPDLVLYLGKVERKEKAPGVEEPNNGNMDFPF